MAEARPSTNPLTADTSTTGGRAACGGCLSKAAKRNGRPPLWGGDGGWVDRRSVVVDKGIYFFATEGTDTIVKLFSFATRKTTTVARISGVAAMRAITISPDGRHLFYTKFDLESQTLMLAENFR